MATLEKIRSRMGVLVAVVIGFALIAFILGDLVNSGSTLLNSSKMTLAEVDGHKISITQFQNRLDEMTETQKLISGKQSFTDEEMAALRDQAWEEMIRETVLDQKLAEEGVAVSETEMVDLIQGNNISPVVRNFFQNPQTGMVDREQIVAFVKSIEAKNADPTRLLYWKYIKDQVKIERLTRKYASLVQRSLYVTSLDAKRALAADANKYSIRFVAQNFFTIPDSSVKVTDADLKEYYNKHKKMFQQEVGRDIEYVVFDVRPSKEDFAAAQQWVATAEPEFAAAQNPAQYAQNNTDKSYDRYFKKGELAAKLDTFAFSASTASFLKPYFDGNSFIMARIADVKMMTDSVKARHILVTGNGNVAATQKLADSLMKAVKAGANFAELAQKYSADQNSAAKGGDMGWLHRGQVDDSTLMAASGSVKVLQAQDGFHVLQVTDKGAANKRVKLAVVQRDVIPSSNTVQSVYNMANSFVADCKNLEDFNAQVAKQKLNKRVASRLSPNERTISGLNSPREIIRWAYEADKGDISKVFELKDQFVVAVLTGEREKGIAPLEQVKSDVEYLVKREKKGEMLEAKMKKELEGVNSIDQLAQKLGTQAADAADIAFSSYIVPNVGIEPALVAAATTVKPNTISKPVVGLNGVYVLQQTGKVVDPAFSIESEKVRISSMNGQRSVYQSYDALRKAAGIEDFRYRFY
ncbi:peptidylprolyl isomerase [Acetobacteroides hydrogenigenes]|uniref:Periplasmic chaperone PpiD n=1 Tax=Acetobacteroides hydrogenigenes TaxID=979970 RepID=A0A4R2E484_9BACT|nr:peptidylprolyl isomerase [Acetobacteroides hydrogenigenes]TCN61376.1 peptidyl-prolyl cis-trans isomerase D [Acetobacteroides hydrogenigenes]